VRRPLIIDGGLATGLEELGHRLESPLWSAGFFLQRPDLVEDLHRTYLECGADILISASYQMSFEGLGRAGLPRAAAADALRRTVETARRARDRFKPSAIVAASVGPYGATLADGSEYHGCYGLDAKQLAGFHRERFEVLAESGADLLAVETIPSIEETEALCDLASRLERVQAWVSFTCRDGACLRDGTPISRAAAVAARVPQVKAIGVNCTAPGHVASLMEGIRSVTDRPILVYPNSGESWDAARRAWTGTFQPARFVRQALEWADRGAWAVGGCCRIGPGVIARLASALCGL
jgi:homocysteine S-methyltransferase